MIERDVLREVREVHGEHRVDDDVLVMGVGLEDPATETTWSASGGPIDRAGGVDTAGSRGDGEQLGANALVDVAVEIDRCEGRRAVGDAGAG